MSVNSAVWAGSLGSQRRTDVAVQVQKPSASRIPFCRGRSVIVLWGLATDWMRLSLMAQACCLAWVPVPYFPPEWFSPRGLLLLSVAPHISVCVSEFQCQAGFKVIKRFLVLCKSEMWLYLFKVPQHFMTVSKSPILCDHRHLVCSIHSDEL